ncbi:MAG: hypothetical protein JW819_04420 [Candidatus Krumholzibacteriota bacterium]|nr:hypothetical protein [Candidatus Krumholzibacteriota bacterium]
MHRSPPPRRGPLPGSSAAVLALALLLAAPAARTAPVPPPPSPAPGLEAPATPPAPRAVGEAARARLAALLDGAAGRAGDRETVRWLGILVEFTDRTFPEEYAEQVDPLDLWEEVPDDSVTVTPRRPWFLNLMRQVDEYYRTVSGGVVELDYVLADSVAVLSGAMGDYGDDALPWAYSLRLVAAEAVPQVDPYVDFSAWDLVTFIHAGPGQESDLLRNSPEQLWSGFLDGASLREAFADSVSAEPGFPGIATDDQGGAFVLERFGLAPEMEREEEYVPPFILGALGVYAHQVAGYLGLVGLGDYVDPQAQGAGNFDLMASGLWNALGIVPGPPSAFNRMLLGWSEPLVIARAAAEDADPTGGLALRLRSWEQAGDSLLLRFPITDREYFLVENRNQDANGDGAFTFGDVNGNHVVDNADTLLGAELDYYTTKLSQSDLMPGSGLLFWRVDEELLRLTFAWDSNVINGFNDHYGVMLLEADGFPDLSTVGYASEYLGCDYDAFRDGDAVLPATQTGLDQASLPSTRSAEGADSGWRFHGIGPAGPVMDLTARWQPGWVLAETVVAGRLPLGDPLAADLLDDGSGSLELLVAATDGDGTTCWLYAFDELGASLADTDGDPATADPLAALDALPAGSPAAGDLDGDGDDDIVLLLRDGRLYAWDAADLLAAGAAGSPLAVPVDSAAFSPLLFDLDRRADGGSDEPGLELLVMGVGPDSSETALHWLDGDGAAYAGFADSLAVLWPAVLSGTPAGDAALAWEVAPAERGHQHPAPDAAFVNVCVVDTTLAGCVHRLQIWRDEDAWAGLDALRSRMVALTVPEGGPVRLASGDTDGDGTDELLAETAAGVALWHAAGRWSGALAGDSLLVLDDIGGRGGLALVPADLAGNGTLAALALDLDRLAACGPDGDLLSGWWLDLPQTDPLPDPAGPAVWALTHRDADDRDWPLLCTRDGRMFAGRAALAADAPVLLGANLAGAPVLADGDADGLLELYGVSGFAPALGTTAAEDTLVLDARLRLWRAETEWTAVPGAWSQGGADAARTRRVAAGRAVTLPAAGGPAFLEAYAYPNPAGDRLTWRVRTDDADRFTVALFDLEGQKLWEGEGLTDGLAAWERELSLVGLAPGVYLYRIASERTGRLEVGRLAVIR